MMQGTQQSSPEMIRIAVTDSNRMATQLLCTALAAETSFRPVGAASAQEIVEAEPQVVLIGANIDGGTASACVLVRELRDRLPKARAILLAEQHTREVVLEAFRAGARGVFSRSESVDALFHCITKVHSGEVWVDQTDIKFLLEAISEPIPMRFVDAKGRVLLSEREQCVVRCVSEGLTNREIASQLELSEHTVKNYLFRIFEKVGVSSRVELILYALAQLRPATENAVKTTVGTDPMLLATAPPEAEVFPPLAIAELYRDGRGVPEDKVNALMWFTVAEALAGEMRRKTKTAQNELKAAMSAEDVAVAQRGAGEWLGRRRSGSVQAGSNVTPLAPPRRGMGRAPAMDQPLEYDSGVACASRNFRCSAEKKWLLR